MSEQLLNFPDVDALVRKAPPALVPEIVSVQIAVTILLGVSDPASAYTDSHAARKLLT